MKASVGDRIIILSHHLGEPNRDCEVLQVEDAEGRPPYLVRWEYGGHEVLFFPGSDAHVQHFDHAMTKE